MQRLFVDISSPALGPERPAQRARSNWNHGKHGKSTESAGVFRDLSVFSVVEKIEPPLLRSLEGAHSFVWFVVES
jgi:hypothetical protein